MLEYIRHDVYAVPYVDGTELLENDELLVQWADGTFQHLTVHLSHYWECGECVYNIWSHITYRGTTINVDLNILPPERISR